MEVAILNKAGEDTGKKAELKDSIFAIEPNDHAIYLDVKQYLANQRQGTHKAKERGEITGSTKKIKRQKGTGTARAGSIKSPIFRGGGRIFGPRPRNYGFKLNTKLKRLARQSALSYKAKENKVAFIEELNFEINSPDAPKLTKQMATLKNNVTIADRRLLIVLPEQNKNVYLSSRNLQDVEVVVASELNTYQVMRSSAVLFADGAVEVLDKILNA
jgi:large subunit ribosomal protein L4